MLAAPDANYFLSLPESCVHPSLDFSSVKVKVCFLEFSRIFSLFLKTLFINKNIDNNDNDNEIDIVEGTSSRPEHHSTVIPG